MRELNSQEQAFISQTLAEIVDLAALIGTDASAISATAYMDHEHLAMLLATLSDRAAEASQWVAAMPHEHSA